MKIPFLHTQVQLNNNIKFSLQKEILLYHVIMNVYHATFETNISLLFLIYTLRIDKHLNVFLVKSNNNIGLQSYNERSKKKH